MFYHSSVHEAEISKIQSETGRLNQNLSQDKKIKLQTREQIIFKEAKEAEKTYIFNINSANSHRDQFIENTKEILNEFQKMDEILVEVIKEKLQKYLDFQGKLNKNLNSELSKSNDLVAKINSVADTKEFMDKNNTHSLPPYKLDFIPYAFDMQTKAYDQTPFPSKIVEEVKIFISNAFYSESPELEVRCKS